MYKIPDEIVKVWKILFLVFIVVLVISISLVYILILTHPEVDLETQIDPAIINGIFTGFAIIFAFVSLEIREIKAHLIEKFLLNFPLILSFVMAITKYSSDIFEYGYPTYWSLIVVVSGVFFNVFYVVEILIAKERYQKLHEKGIHWESK